MEHAVVDAAATTPAVVVPDGVRASAALGALGMPGLTAFAAVRRHVRPRPGDTVVVASATGAVLRSSPTLADDLRAACPDRVDAYLHMGDQATLDVVMEQLAVGARVSLVGVPDQNNGAAPTRMRVGAVMAARAEVHGMVVYDHHDLAADHVAEVGDRLATHAFAVPESRSRGLASAGAAFSRMTRGGNVGKVVVQVATR